MNQKRLPQLVCLNTGIQKLSFLPNLFTQPFFKVFLFLFLAYCCFTPSTLQAQAVNNQIKDVVMPSPNAASLGKYGDIPVSLYTGVPSVGIPIYSIQDGPLSLPISLSYHAGGVKVGEPCSWVGLNWSLQAGGMISRSVQGKADERIDGYMSIGQNISVVLTPVTLDANNECIAYNNSINNSGLQNYTLGLNNGSADSEPDIFSYSVGGYSGKFYIEADVTNDGVINGKVITIPKQDVKIDYTLDGSGSNIKRLTNFTITTPDGVKYEFGKIDSEANDGIEITKPFNAQVDQYTTGWYLRRVSTPDGKNKIILKYSPEKHRYGFRASTGGSLNNTMSTPFGGYNESILDIIGYRLKSIENSLATEIVTFVEGEDRTDLKVTPGASLAENAKRLSEIKIENGTYCKKFILSHTRFEDNSTLKSGHDADFRLKLNSVQEVPCTATTPPTPSVQPYVFTYYGEAGNENFLPNRLSSAIDHWGYYNGATDNPTSGLNIPFTRLTYTNTGNFQMDENRGFSNRETNEDKMKLGNIQQVKYPTGGTSTFEYEANSYLETQGIKTLNLINTLNAYWITGYFSEQPGFQQASTTLYQSFDDLNNTFFSWDYKKAQNYSPGMANITNNPSTVILEVYQGNSTTLLSSNSVANSADDNIITNIKDKLLHIFPFLQANVEYRFVLKVSNAASQLFFQKEVAGAPYNRKVGGLRVTKLTSHDAVNTANNIIKTYSYNKWASVASGRLYNKPVYGYVFDNVIGACTPDVSTSGTRFKNHFWSDNSIVPLGSFEGYHIGYEQVTETANGLSTQYIYALEDAQPFEGLPQSPERPRIGSGELLNKVQVNTNNQTVSEEKYTPYNDPYETGLGTYIKYNTYGFGNTNSGGDLTLQGYVETSRSKVGNTLFIFTMPIFGVSPSSTQQWTISFWKKYNIRTRPYRLSKVETTVDNVISTTEYTYDALNRFLAPIEVKTTNSDNKIFITKSYYAHNLLETHLNYALKSTLINQFMIGIPLQQELYIDGVKKGGSVMEYKVYGSGVGYMELYPYQSYSINHILSIVMEL